MILMRRSTVAKARSRVGSTSWRAGTDATTASWGSVPEDRPTDQASQDSFRRSEALRLKAGLSELIFATTAPDDTGATDAALAVERQLKGEAMTCASSVYGWGQLQTVIALHPGAYAVFHPSAVATSTQRRTEAVDLKPESAGLIADQLIERLLNAGIGATPRESRRAPQKTPALHARIDTYRDLFRDQQVRVAEAGLLALLRNEDLSAKPWARYRIETNLGSIAMELGPRGRSGGTLRDCHAVRPDEPQCDR